jgi:hypothetical protein
VRVNNGYPHINLPAATNFNVLKGVFSNENEIP